VVRHFGIPSANSRDRDQWPRARAREGRPAGFYATARAAGGAAAVALVVAGLAIAILWALAGLHDVAPWAIDWLYPGPEVR
jgi:hypothetical protein